jgi:hypothetical protein
MFRGQLAPGPVGVEAAQNSLMIDGKVLHKRYAGSLVGPSFLLRHEGPKTSNWDGMGR